MVILKTLMLTSSLFGLTSGSISETTLPDLNTCQQYIQSQIDSNYSSEQFTVKLSNGGAYANVEYANWPFNVMVTHECVELK